MAKINATVTATDTGGEFKLSIDKNPIKVPPGQHQIVWQLVDSTTQGPTIFDAADPIFYDKGANCPNSGRNCNQLTVQSCSDTMLNVADDNGDSIGSIGYQLNFKYGNQKKPLDPIIINS